MTHRTAFKTACIKYAQQASIPLPDGVNTSDTYGVAARELTKKIQRRNKLKQDGNITPETLLVVGRWLPGGTVGERAVWAMRCMIGPLEVWGQNSGPYVEQIQRLGVNDFKPGSWPYCAATVSWALRSAGWRSWGAFAKTGEGEAGVITWKNAAEAGRYGLSIKNYRTGTTGDLVVYGSDAHHIGFLDSRVNPLTGDCYGIEGNTASQRSGRQGLFRQTRNAAPPQTVIRVR
jgi:hypothetical protein